MGKRKTLNNILKRRIKFGILLFLGWFILSIIMTIGIYSYLVVNAIDSDMDDAPLKNTICFILILSTFINVTVSFALARTFVRPAIAEITSIGRYGLEKLVGEVEEILKQDKELEDLEHNKEKVRK